MASYTQGAGIDEPLAMYSGPTTSYFHADGLGSITSLTDSSGQLTASYVYDAFGDVTASTGTVTNPFRYTGREFDPETGLYYYRARYYDPTTGRFISEDPVRFKAGKNFYPYVDSSPTNLRDPSGLLRDCDQEHIECFRRCWSKCPPWPIERGRRGHYLYCQSKCLAEYMECEGENARERARQYCEEHPLVCAATIVAPVIDPIVIPIPLPVPVPVF